METIKQKPIYKYLMALTIASAGGLQGWRTLYNNFAVDVVGLDGYHVGVIQSVREVPGFLALCAIFVLMIIREHKLSALSVMVMGLGIALTGCFPSYPGLILTTIIMSFGFHYYETTNQSLILQNFDQSQAPVVIGRQRSIMSLICILIGAGVFAGSYYLSYKSMFAIIGSAVMAVGLWGLFFGPKNSDGEVQHKKLILRKRYSLFYLLTLLSGARRQIFMVFSVFLLVQRMGFTIQEITALFIVNNIINYFVTPQVAKAINRFGERAVLTAEYGSLIIIFAAYAYCPYKWVIMLLYILDHISFNGSMAIRTFFHKIADPQDIASSTAVSFTINHIAAVVLPVVGGYLWMIDYKLPFMVGIALSVISLTAAQFIRVTNR